MKRSADKSATILVVDDQPDNIYVLRRLLRAQGYAVLEAGSGSDALRSVARRRPDLILLDVMMPEMDGFEVVQQLREDSAMRGIPVVLLTANAPDERLKIQGLNLGADEYLTQPINNNELLARVEALLRTKRAQDEVLARNAQLSALLDIVQASTSTLELAEVGRRLIGSTLSALEIEAGGIWLREGDMLVCLARRGYSAEAADEPADIPADSRVSRLAMERQQPIYGPTAELYGADSALARETRTTVVLPLLHRGEAHGVLHLGTSADRTFEAEHLAFLGAIANAAAVAVQNARLFEESQRQRELLQQLDLEKDEFISIIAHELKNPLASIKGYAGLLQRRARKDNAPPASFKGLDVIEQQANRMNLLLDQLRDVSQIGMDRFEIDPAPLDMADLTQRVALDMQATTNDHRLMLDVRQRDTRLLANADEFRMAQVLANLISNAIKYSPDGGDIEIYVGAGAKPPCASESPAQRWVTVTVKDSGIGIPVDVRERLFQRFFRAPNAKGRVSGMGLGLYITREIIQRHGGCMWLESEEGSGSLFGVALPLISEPAAVREGVAADGWRGDGVTGRQGEGSQHDRQNVKRP